MAGAKRSKEETLAKKIAALDEKIAKCKDQLKGYQDQKKQLEDELASYKMQKLQTFMDEKGLTIEELKKLVK